MMKKLLFLPLLFLISATISEKRITGFTDASSARQRQAEQRFDELIKTDDIDMFLKQLSARPHHLGSEGGKLNAQYLLKAYQSWGYDARIDTFYALFPTPKTRLLEAYSPDGLFEKANEPATGKQPVDRLNYKDSLKELPLKEDATSSQTNEQLPTYNCFSADGDVTGELVYVNRGVPADYEQLERMGIDVKGKIVIAKYGGSWRGIKPRLAQEHGAIGCIIYSDPKDDGYSQGDVYPVGPFRNETGVQRGSVLDMPLYPGDPLTPGYAHTKDAKLLDKKDAKPLLKIPVLPVSYGDAKPLLAALGGPVAPESWNGALPITYHIGAGPVKVHLKLEFNWNIVPVYNVIAVLKGSEYPDEWVMRGNHHDAWVNGAADPLSGQCAMLAEAKAVATLAKEGMPFKRTIIYCSWDGEEEGLIGSTEWVEQNAAELQQKAVVYINTDGNGRGFLHVGASHALQTFVNEVAADVTDPQTGVSVLKRRIAKDKITELSDGATKQSPGARDVMKVSALGSGSDYSSFLQHLGIACMNVGYDGEDDGGEYHSIYDSYDMFVRFKDPELKYEATLSKTTGRFTMRLANAEVLPFKFSELYATVNDYVTDLSKKLDEMRTQTEETNRAIEQNYFVIANDPTQTYMPPKAKEPVPYLNFSELQNAMAGMKALTDKLKDLMNSETVMSYSSEQNHSRLVKLNNLIYQSERKLLLDNGLPGRPWYRHAIYAPGYYTGYGVKTLPGIREAIENRDWKLAQQQTEEAAKTLNDFNRHLNSIIALLQSPANATH